MIPADRARARVVIFDGDRVALIKRVRDGMTYFIFPGGGVEDGETPEQAAIREAHEELGVDVRLVELMHEDTFRGHRFFFFRAEIVGGEFGTGAWPDHADLTPLAREKSGTHEAVWIDLGELRNLDVRPRELVDRLVP